MTIPNSIIVIIDDSTHMLFIGDSPIKESKHLYAQCLICQVKWPCWAVTQAVQPIDILNPGMVESNDV